MENFDGDYSLTNKQINNLRASVYFFLSKLKNFPHIRKIGNPQTSEKKKLPTQLFQTIGRLVQPSTVYSRFDFTLCAYKWSFSLRHFNRQFSYFTSLLHIFSSFVHPHLIPCTIFDKKYKSWSFTLSNFRYSNLNPPLPPVLRYFPERPVLKLRQPKFFY